MKKLIPILVFTFFLYLTVAYLSTPFSNFDTKSYSAIGALTLSGKSIYPDPAISRHPYLPLFLYLEAGTLFLSHIIHIPQMLILKCLFSLFHLASIYVVYHLSKKNSKTTFLYAFNPISLFIIAFHGQFDIIPLFLILSSILLLQKKKYTTVMIYLGLAFAIKTWPILFIIPFLKRIPKKSWIWFLLLPSLTILLYLTFFHASLFSVARVLVVYQGVPGIWGFGKLFSFISTQKIFLLTYKILFVLGILFYSFKQKKKRIVEELFELLLLFFIFTPGFGIQWFLWLAPFLFLTKRPFIHLFISAITLCLCIVYSSWTPIAMISPQKINTILFFVWPLFINYYVFFILLKKKYSL